MKQRQKQVRDGGYADKNTANSEEGLISSKSRSSFAAEFSASDDLEARMHAVQE
jgi:hypothetical protein